MVKKITISVPDELHEKMMTWKDSFNFSRVFQEAMDDLILKKEEFNKRLKGGTDMTEVIERLKEEKAEAETEWFDIGKLDGLEFAKSADYKTLMYALQWEPMSEMDDYLVSYHPEKDEKLGDYFQDMIDQYASEGMGVEQRKPGNWIPNNIFEQWEFGWHFGVGVFWQEIKDKI